MTAKEMQFATILHSLFPEMEIESLGSGKFRFEKSGRYLELYIADELFLDRAAVKDWVEASWRVAYRLS